MRANEALSKKTRATSEADKTEAAELVDQASAELGALNIEHEALELEIVKLCTIAEEPYVQADNLVENLAFGCATIIIILLCPINFLRPT